MLMEKFYNRIKLGVKNFLAAGFIYDYLIPLVAIVLFGCLLYISLHTFFSN